MKTVSYALQALVLKLFFALFALLPPKKASLLGGRILKLIAPLFKKQNRNAMKNLSLIYPDKSMGEKMSIINGMWLNIGMNLGEYPHLKKAYNDHPDFKVHVVGQDNLSTADTPTVYISAHTGNWEILPLMTAKIKRPFQSLYRPPNNPFIRTTLNNLRTLGGILPEAHIKGNKGLIALTRHAKQGDDIGVLLDQRHSGGEKISFFGHDVDASFAPIDIALKYNAHIILGRVVRLGACTFTLEILPPLETDGRTRTDIMNDIYKTYETWINECPEQWLWMHRRWGKNI